MQSLSALWSLMMCIDKLKRFNSLIVIARQGLQVTSEFNGKVLQ